jgi:4'-phosphopantetheinyl transferase EntD
VPQVVAGASSLVRLLTASLRTAGARVELEPYDDAIPANASTAGRRAAGRALARFGGASMRVDDRFADGRPRWPTGTTGSITHASGCAIAVVFGPGATTRFGSRCVGIDLELDRALAPDDAAYVLNAAERARVASSSDPASTATVLWSAKEAAFKAWSEHVSGALPSVQPHIDLDVRLDPARGQLEVVALGSLRDALESHAPPAPVRLVGRWWRAAPFVLCVVTTDSFL